MNGGYTEVSLRFQFLYVFYPHYFQFWIQTQKICFLSPTEFVITRFHCMSIATDPIEKQYIGLDIDKFTIPSISVQLMATSPTGMLKY